MTSFRLSKLLLGEPIQLRNNVLPYVKIRNWTFQEIEGNDRILLNHQEKGYVLEVKEDDIDWEEYQKYKADCRRMNLR